MRAVAIRELKNRLSAYLREVARGEVVLVTDRGKVVAELRRPTVGSDLSPEEAGLQRLADQGLLTLGLPQDPQAYLQPRPRLQGVDPQALLDAERRDAPP